MDRTREVGWLALRRDPGGAARWVRRGRSALVDRGAVYACAEMLGGAARVLDLAVEYAKDRVQFGRPIGSFQAVKHRCADMLVDVEGMRSATYWAAWCVGGRRPGRVGRRVDGQDLVRRRVEAGDGVGLQVHGGIGFTWEHDLHLFLKRAQLDQLAFGDAAFHRERLAALLRPRVEAGESVI